MNRHRRTSSPVSLEELHAVSKDDLPEFLLKRCGDGIYRAALSAAAGNKDLLDDCLYFTVLALFRDNFTLVRTFKGRSSFEGFLRAVTVRISQDILRCHRADILPAKSDGKACREISLLSVCPTDEDLSLFIERKSSDERYLKVKDHCSSCSLCQSRIRAVRALNGTASVPKGKMERVFAAALTRSRGSSLKRAASFLLLILAVASLVAAAVASYIFRR